MAFVGDTMTDIRPLIELETRFSRTAYSLCCDVDVDELRLYIVEMMIRWTRNCGEVRTLQTVRWKVHELEPR